jgi:tetratricopeptide (TPR) repeat protein
MMNKKSGFFLSIPGLAILAALSFFTFKFIIDSPYGKQLPEYPDFNTINGSLREQISAASRKALRNPSAQNLGRLGMVYHSGTYYDKAVKCYQLAVKRNEGEWIWSYYLGYLNLELGESGSSIENFRTVLKYDQKNTFATFYTADANQNLGNSIEAERIFKIMAALNENDLVKRDTIRQNDYPLKTYAMFRLARIYLNSNRTDSAEAVLKEIIRNQITFGPAYRLLGNVYATGGNIILGNKYNIRANDLVEYTPPSDQLIDKITLMSRSDTYLLKQIDDALHSLNFNWELMLFDHALKYIPDNKFLLSKAIFGYLYLGFGEKAIPYLDKHFNYYIDDYKELMLFAILLYDKGFREQAMKYFNQAKKVKPGNSELSLWLADRGMMEEAITLMNEQLKSDPENPKVLSDAANLMLKFGNKEMATVYLDNLKNLSPSNNEATKLSAIIAENEGNFKVALSHYENFLRSDPKDLFVIRRLAAIYIKDKTWDKAIRHFRMALDYYPNEPFILEGIGKLLISCPDTSLRDNMEGREFSERAFINYRSTIITKISAGRNLATVYAITGDKQSALKYINLTIDLARKVNLFQEYSSYFETLKRQYKI